MSHTDKVTELPQEFNIILSTDNTPITAIENIEKKFTGSSFILKLVTVKVVMKFYITSYIKFANAPNLGIHN